MESVDWRRKALQFESDFLTLQRMYYAIDVGNAEATASSEKAMIFAKILSYEEGLTGFTLCEEFWRDQEKPAVILS